MNFLTFVLSMYVAKDAQKSRVMPLKKVGSCFVNNLKCRANDLYAHDSGISKKAAYDLMRGYLKEKISGKIRKPIATIVDFSKSSSKKRLQVINMNNYKVLFNAWVAHGEGSGYEKPTKFSNKINSHESSLGFYRTDDSYYGVDGYSMRIEGLQKGLNSNAFRRDIVVHPAWYVGAEAIKKYGHIGRTWGCFGLSKKISREIINTIKGGTLLYAYYPGKVKPLSI